MKTSARKQNLLQQLVENDSRVVLLGPAGIFPPGYKERLQSERYEVLEVRRFSRKLQADSETNSWNDCSLWFKANIRAENWMELLLPAKIC